ncbi:hypothetical protein Plhal304r1_c062g0149171 [Plasmopara halstedii]
MALFRSLFQHYKALHDACPTPPYFSAVLSAPSPPSLLAMTKVIKREYRSEFVIDVQDTDARSGAVNVKDAILLIHCLD